MKKRYIVLGLIALDILCFPLAAQLLNKASQISFSSSEHAIASELPRIDPGVTHLVVTASKPFVLTAANLNGTANIAIKNSGAINTTRFGDNAQMPGPKHACIQAYGENSSVIYSANRATSVKDGEILSQSVIMTIRYPKDENPDFRVELKTNVKNLPTAAACEEVAT